MAQDLLKVFGLGCLGLIVVSIGLGVVLFRNRGDCPAEIDQRVAAPDRSRDAVVYHFECGFGRKGTTSVSVVPGGADPPSPANLFVAMDSNALKFLTGAAVPPPVEVIWEDLDALLIRYGASAKVVVRNPSVGTVRVRYEERE